MVLGRSWNSSTKQQALANQLLIGKYLIQEPRSLASTFNKYFAGTGRTIKANIPNYIIIFSNYPPNPTENSFYLTPPTLKSASSLLSFPLSNIINKPFDSACFPSMIKLARVVPIRKTGPLEAISNYRPISLLSIIAKIFEDVMQSRLMHSTFLYKTSTL